jgi:hypothetical protein
MLKFLFLLLAVAPITINLQYANSKSATPIMEEEYDEFLTIDPSEDTLIYTENKNGKGRFSIKKQKREILFENNFGLFENIKIPTERDLKNKELYGLPLPDWIGEKYTSITYNPFLQFTSGNKRYIFYTSAFLSEVHQEKDNYTFLEFVDFGGKIQALQFFKNKYRMYGAVSYKKTKNYIHKFNGKSVFENGYETSAFTSNHISLYETFLQLDLGYRRGNYFEDGFFGAFFKFPLSSYQDVKINFETSAEISSPIIKKNRKNEVKNFEKYGSFFIKTGPVFEIAAKKYISFYFFYKKDKKFGVKTEALFFSYSIKY